MAHADLWEGFGMPKNWIFARGSILENLKENVSFRGENLREKVSFRGENLRENQF